MSSFMSFITRFLLISVASTSAVKRWDVPVCTNITAFVYAGCFTDLPDQGALVLRSDLDYNNMTVETCVNYCKGRIVAVAEPSGLISSSKRLQICRP